MGSLAHVQRHSAGPEACLFLRCGTTTRGYRLSGPGGAALVLIGSFHGVRAGDLVPALLSRQQAADPQGFRRLRQLSDRTGRPTFWQALGRTFGFLLLVLPIEVALGLGIALLLHKPGLGILASCCASPGGPAGHHLRRGGPDRPSDVQRQFGVVNSAGLLGFAQVEWLGQPTTAFLAVAIMDVWQWTPFVRADLARRPRHGARRDRGGGAAGHRAQWDVLRHVQLPYLLPGLTAVLILRTADMLKLFDMVFVMTRGGPGSATELISVYIQRIGFRVFDQGIASAQAILLLIVTILLSRLYIRLVYREIADEARPRRTSPCAAALIDALAILAAMFPFYWMVLTSAEDQAETLAIPPPSGVHADARPLPGGAVRRRASATA